MACEGDPLKAWNMVLVRYWLNVVSFGIHLKSLADDIRKRRKTDISDLFWELYE